VRQFAAFSETDLCGNKIISSFLRTRFLEGLPPFGLPENESPIQQYPEQTLSGVLLYGVSKIPRKFYIGEILTHKYAEWKSYEKMMQ
jgi:hypothetical protein